MDPPEQKPYLITGVVGGNYPRLEIRKLAKNPKQFALFILGWEEIRKPDYEPLAAQHVQLSGIHGLPHERWPGDPEGKEAPHPKPQSYQVPWLGYCNHESVLFPLWHRPVVMLLEQSICEAARKIADRFAKKCPEEAGEWKQAAEQLRFPYWDWTDPSTGTEGLPDILYREELNLTLPPGESQPAYNMLAHYEFGAKLPNGFQKVTQENELLPQEVTSYFNIWDRTYRWPKMRQVDPGDGIDEINNRLKSGLNTGGSWLELRNDVATMFGFGDTAKQYPANAWDQFSNVRFQSGQQSGKPIPDALHWDGVNSIEKSHNHVHLLVGGTGGHMMDNGYASFDPIFFLHHCNVDRLLAFWEHVYPEVFMGENGYLTPDGSSAPFREVVGTWALKEEQDVKGSTSLFPFRQGDGCYWTPYSSRWNGDQSQPRYYTYPSIPDPAHPDDPKFAVDPNKPVSDSTELERQRAVLQKYFGLDHVQLRQTEFKKNGYHLSLPPPKRNHDEGYEPIHKYRHFVIDVLVNPFSPGCSYSVDLWYNLGADGEGIIGSASVLVRSSQEHCAGCQSRRAAGAKGRYVIVIPHSISVKILGNKPHEAPEIAIIKALRAKITFPGFIPIGRLDPSETKHDPAFPGDLAPVISLSSAAVQAKVDNTLDHDTEHPQDTSPLTPYETYDWQHYGELPGSWVKDN